MQSKTVNVSVNDHTRLLLIEQSQAVQSDFNLKSEEAVLLKHYVENSLWHLSSFSLVYSIFCLCKLSSLSWNMMMLLSFRLVSATLVFAFFLKLNTISKYKTSVLLFIKSRLLSEQSIFK